MGSRSYGFDILTLLKDAGAITASAAAQVGGSNKIIDLGANTRVDAIAVIDVTAIDIASADEFYDVVVQVSNSSSFASGIENVAALNLGKSAGRFGGAQDSTIGRYELPFCTEQNDTFYRYMRLYTVCGGTTPSINYTAFYAPIPDNA